MNYYLKIIIIFIFLLSVTILIYIGRLTQSPEEKREYTEFTFPNYIPPQVSESREPFTIPSDSGRQYDARPLTQHADTYKVSEQTYGSSEREDYYVIYYHEPNGSFMIDLYDENLAVARLYAEEHLRKILPYSEEELCDMDIVVRTNEFVSEDYAGLDLGLTFCPFPIKL